MITENDLKDEGFDEATKKVVVDACNGAWLLLQTFGDSFANKKRHPEVQALVNRRIINAARMGMSDIVALQQAGVRYVRDELAQQWPKDN